MVTYLAADEEDRVLVTEYEQVLAADGPILRPGEETPSGLILFTGCLYASGHNPPDVLLVGGLLPIPCLDWSI